MGLKRVVALVAALVVYGGVSAQSWSDFLGGLLGGGSASQTQTKTETETYPESVLGVWKYSAPAVIFTGDDIVAKLGATVASSTIKEQMTAYYTKAGVTPQTCTLQFRRNGKFVAKAAEHEMEGRYSYNSASGALSVTIELEGLGTRNFIGKVTGDSSKASVTFEAAKVAGLAHDIPSVSNDQRIMSLVSLLEQYKGMYVGAEFVK